MTRAVTQDTATQAASVPQDVSGLQALIHDAAQLSARYDDLRYSWNHEQRIARDPGDPLRTWRGWLGFSVLAAHVVGYADPTNPPDEDELAPLRRVFADVAVREVMLAYYGGVDDNGAPAAHRDREDRQFLNKIRGTSQTPPDLPGLLPRVGQPSTWGWDLHRIGTSALVLRATPPDGTGLDALAIKVIVPPYLRWEEIRRATKESGELGRLRVESDALAKSFGSTEAVLITSFVQGPTFAEVLAARDALLRGEDAATGPDGAKRKRRRLTDYSEADGVRFALAYWLPVVRSLAQMDKVLSDKGVPKGHGDLNPSNVIFRDDSDPSAHDADPSRIVAEDRARAQDLGLAARVGPGPRRRIEAQFRELALVGPTLERRRHDPGAVFVDLGPSHLLQANPGSGVQSVSHLSRYTAPELLRAEKRIDRQKADLYNLGDLLLDALVPADLEDGERVERVYRYSFELGQLIDSLRSYDRDLRTAIFPPLGRPISWDELADQTEEILKAALALGGTGLRAYSLLNLVSTRWSPDNHPATRRTGPADRAATLGSREAWTINWFRASRALASFVIGTMVLGMLSYAVLGCDSVLAGSLCAVESLPGWLRLDDASAYRFGILAVLVSWLFAAHLYYIRMFAQLQPRLCRELRWRKASEISMRAIAAPLYVLFFAGFVLPETWWFWAALGAILAGVNNWIFTRFLGSAVEHLQEHAEGPPSQDSLAATANRVETFVRREYGRWWLMMVIYGVVYLAAGAWLAFARAMLEGQDLTGDQLDAAMSLVEWPLIVAAVVVNLTMLYRNCSEMGAKAPEVRANGARAIAGYLRLQAASHR